MLNLAVRKLIVQTTLENEHTHTHRGTQTVTDTQTHLSTKVTQIVSETGTLPALGEAARALRLDCKPEASGVSGLGFRVWVYGLGFRGLGFRV